MFDAAHLSTSARPVIQDLAEPVLPTFFLAPLIQDNLLEAEGALSDCFPCMLCNQGIHGSWLSLEQVSITFFLKQKG